MVAQNKEGLCLCTKVFIAHRDSIDALYLLLCGYDQLVTGNKGEGFTYVGIHSSSQKLSGKRVKLC